MPRKKTAVKGGRKTKKEAEKKEEDIQINLRDSSISEFTKRPVPNEDEVAEFEEYMEDEARDEEIDQGLTEIYQDEEGHLVDVHKLEKIRRKGFLLSLVNFLFFILIFGGGAYWLYDNWYKNASLDTGAVELSIEGDGEVVVQEEIEYRIVYKNENRTALKNAKLNVSFPRNFILESTEPDTGSNRGVWSIGDIAAFSEGEVKVRGRMIAPLDSSGILSAYFSYTPEGFSSEYKKDAFLTTKVVDTGLDIDIDYYETALVGEVEELFVTVAAMEKNFITDFRLSLEPQENLTNINYIPEGDAEEMDKYLNFKIDRPGIWEVSGILDEDKKLPVRFKINDKSGEKQELVFKFEKKASDGQYYEFYEESVSLDIMKNNINLAMIVNAERDKLGVDFGETLNYSIVYNNKGDSDIKDVVVMAVLEGDYLDWTTLDDKNGGREKGNIITWSKDEIPELAEIKQDAEGVIDFSIQVLEFGAVDLEASHTIESYARFSLGEMDTDEDEETDNKSNTVIATMNSDLSFEETIRYFNEDNIPVGDGPNPPQVGQTTSYKVYWKLTNNLHELNKLGVTMKLPDYVDYSEKDRATVGSIIYSEETHEIVWNIGRLPTSVYQAGAEFNISVTPREDDRNKIMVLLPGSSVQAVDAETEEDLKIETKAKTSQLKDDEIGESDGIVE